MTQGFDATSKYPASVDRPPAAARKHGSTRSKLRLGLLALGVGKGAVATWAIVAPGSFYLGFPASGGRWLSPMGAYNEHLVTDLGGAQLAVAGILLLAAVELQRRLVQTALVATLLQSLPHLGYHLHALPALPPLDGLVQAVALALVPALGIHLLVLSRELGRHGAQPAVDVATAGSGRHASPATEADGRLVPSGASSSHPWPADSRARASRDRPEVRDLGEQDGELDARLATTPSSSG